MDKEESGEKLVGPTVKNPDGYRDLGRSQQAKRAGEPLEWITTITARIINTRKQVLGARSLIPYFDI